MAPPRVKLRVENFGPIVEGTVEFKPLTFLIGANNSGKTYVATLLYALAKAMIHGVVITFPRPLDDPETARAFLRSGNGAASFPLILKDLPAPLHDLIKRYFGDHKNETTLLIEQEIQRAFTVAELGVLGSASSMGRNDLRIELTAQGLGQSLVSIEATSAQTRVSIPHDLPSQIGVADTSEYLRALPEPEWVPVEIALYGWLGLVQSGGFRFKDAFYLPGARSGVLESWPLLASLAVRSVSGPSSTKRIDTPALPGVLGDFLQDLIERFAQVPLPRMDRSRFPRADLASVLEILERQLLTGRIVINRTDAAVAQILFETESLRIPIQRSSSMVAELAPVDLWVREVLVPGDLLIIDEPESHLHPANQRLIARALVRLVNAGVDVVAPTHSSTILHQVSNMLLASTLDEATRTKLGYTDADLISADDVAVYLFEQRDDGVHIVPVPIEPGFGIAEDEFVRVAEAIGDETFRLSFAASHQPA